MSNTSAWLSYIQLLDSAFPIGSFSHSFGLETYVQKGRINDLRQLEQYMNAQLEASIIPLDALSIQAVYRCLDEHSKKGDPEYGVTGKDAVLNAADSKARCLLPMAHGDRCCQQLLRIDGLCHTQRTARESREGMHKMGRRLLKLGKSLYPEAQLEQLEQLLEEGRGYGSYPIVYAWITWNLHIEEEQAILGYLYTSLQMSINCALRLMSLGQTDGQLLVRKVVKAAEAAWQRFKLQGFTEPFSYAVVNDVLAMQHETLYSRLFMS